MIESGQANIGDRVVCPDGVGEVVHVYNADNVRIKLDEKGAGDKVLYCVFDANQCTMEKK